MRSPIRSNQSVHAEVAVVREPLFLPSAINKNRILNRAFTDIFPVFSRYLTTNPLFHPVPDIPAHVMILRIDAFMPVFIQVSVAVAHRMGVFAKNKGFACVLNLSRSGIHTAGKIRFDCMAALVVNGTRGIHLMNHLAAGGKVRAGTGFITQRPDNNARMVFVAFHHAADTVQMRLLPLRSIGQFVVGSVAVGVGLNVGFVHHPDTVLIAQVIEFRHIGIVAGPNRVNIIFLPHPDVFQHRFAGDHLPQIRVGFVTVNPFDFNEHAVHIEMALFDLHLAETDALRNHFDQLAVFLKRQQNRVETGIFVGPFFRIFNLHFQRTGSGCGSNFLPLGIEQLHLNRRTGSGNQLGIHLQHSVLIPVVQIGHDVDVTDIVGRTGLQVNIPEDAGHAPEILVFQIRAVAPAIHLGRQQVFPRLQVLGDIKLRRRTAALAVANLFAVDPQVKGRVNAVKRNEHLFAVPVFRETERLTVGADLIDIILNKGRIFRKRIGLIAVDQRTIIMNGPVGWHRNGFPRAVIKVGFVKVQRPFRGLRRPVELPIPVQQLEMIRLLTIIRQRVLPVLKGIKCHVRLHRIDLNYLLIFPVMRNLRHCRRTGQQCEGQHRFKHNHFHNKLFPFH